MQFYDNFETLFPVRNVVDMHLKNITCTVGSKITQALEIIHVKNAYIMQFNEINICQVMILRLDTVYNKQEMMIIIGNQIREKWQILSQVLE